jgi:hypothetical protein
MKSSRLFKIGSPYLTVLVSPTCHTYILSPSTHGPDLGRSWPAARLADGGAPLPSPRHCLAASRAPLAQPATLPSGWRHGSRRTTASKR